MNDEAKDLQKAVNVRDNDNSGVLRECEKDLFITSI